MSEPPEERVGGLTRLTAMSDGVFAIALTLLVLDVRLPPETRPATDRALLAALADLAPHLYSYGFSFLLLGLYWLRHHRIFTLIVRYDDDLLWRNLWFLGFVALLPFTSSVLGEYGDLRVAWILFALNFLGISVLLSETWRYAVGHRLVAPEVTPALSRSMSSRGWAVRAVFLLSVVVALFDVRLAELTPLLLLLSPASLIRRRPGRPGGASSPRLSWLDVGRAGGAASALGWRLWAARTSTGRRWASTTSRPTCATSPTGGRARGTGAC